MATPAIDPGFTYEDYLALEQDSDLKHLWLHGEAFAMSGGTPTHALIGANALGEVFAALRGRPCRTYSSDLRVRTPDGAMAAYPDLTVICGDLKPHPDDPDAATNPVALFEVLSPSTEGFDRGDKFAHYRTIPTLRDYVLLSQDAARIEHFARNADGTWTLRVLGPGDTLRLTGADAAVALDAVYDGVTLDPKASARPQV